MRRNCWQGIGALAIALVAGCGNAANADGAEETTSVDATGVDATGVDATGVDASTSADGVCVPGWEGCPCFEDARCIEGLMCLSNHCVLVPDASSSEADGAHESTSDASESSGDASDSSSSEESSTSLPDVCIDDDTYCDNDELQTCVDGQWEFIDCVDACELAGYASQGCQRADSCLCEGHSDAVCDNAAYQHCICIDALYGEVPCSGDQLESEYQACFAEETPANTCWSTYDVLTIEDCEMAVTECGA